MSGTLERLYLHIARRVQTSGSIEIGYHDYSRALVRALDIGEMLYDGLEHYPTLEEVLQALERALAECRRAQDFE